MGAPLPGTVPSIPVGPPQGQQPIQPQYGQYMQPAQGIQNQYQQQQFMNPPASMGTTQNPTPEPAAPPTPQPKAPLPEEFVYLQTVFNELRQQCSNAAQNPVSKEGHTNIRPESIIVICVFISANEEETGRCLQEAGESV